MDDPTNSTKPMHSNFAGRRPAGTAHPVTLTKNGVRHTQRMPDGSEREILAMGLACSECFSGKNLHKVLKPGFELERECMELLAEGKPAPPLSIHTSSGVCEVMEDFINALELHLPWKNKAELDWCVSLQLEGASAVWAAIDLVLQTIIMENKGDTSRLGVMVGATSYHGPPSTSFGAKCPLWRKAHQHIYPVPTAHGSYDEDELIAKYEKFLNEYGHQIGVMLVEPQWGSSQAALPWPEHLLKKYISMARSHGIKIVCDEIMCGLGRHGKGTLFVSEYWDLDPDCVTFGKSIATGVYPLSGAILKQGRDMLSAKKLSVMQSHTYAGSSALALMAATMVLKEFVTWLPSVAKLGDEMAYIMRYLQDVSDGLFICHGQGLMWGGMITHEGQCSNQAFRKKVVDTWKKNCDELCIVPYHVPVGGFMISPVIDIDVGTIYEMGERLEEAVKRTIAEVGWVAIDTQSGEGSSVGSAETPVASYRPMARAPPIASMTTLNLQELEERAIQEEAELRGNINLTDLGNGKCVPYLHDCKTCTACNAFVDTRRRSKFVLSSSNLAGLAMES